jgi:hypothetical protein
VQANISGAWAPQSKEEVFHFSVIVSTPPVTYSSVMPQIAATMPEAKYRKISQRAPDELRATVLSARELEISRRPSKRKSAKPAEVSKRIGSSLASWWPVAVALFLTGFVVDFQSVAEQFGVWGPRLAFPLVQIAAHSEIGFSASAPHAALYLQLPLEGLLTKITLDRGKSLRAAIVQLVLIHGIAAAVLWLAAYKG